MLLLGDFDAVDEDTIGTLIIYKPFGNSFSEYCVRKKNDLCQFKCKVKATTHSIIGWAMITMITMITDLVSAVILAWSLEIIFGFVVLSRNTSTCFLEWNKIKWVRWVHQWRECVQCGDATCFCQSLSLSDWGRFVVATWWTCSTRAVSAWLSDWVTSLCVLCDICYALRCCEWDDDNAKLLECSMRWSKRWCLLLFVVCYLLFVCLLFVICYLLFVVVVVCCLLFVVVVWLIWLTGATCQ